MRNRTGNIKLHDNAAFGVQPQGYGLANQLAEDCPGEHRFYPA
jgi:hypothetical protein